MTRNTSLLAIALVLSALAGGLYAFRADAPRAFLQSPERHTSSVTWFGSGGFAGNLLVCHGMPVWRETYADSVRNPDAVSDGTRFRFGSDFWSTLETTHDVEIGGTKIPAGYYYLAFEKTAGGVGLVAFDAAEMRAKKVPSFQPPQSGGIRIPMTLAETGDEEEELYVEFVVDNRSGDIELEVLWGPFSLSAPVLVDL